MSSDQEWPTQASRDLTLKVLNRTINMPDDFERALLTAIDRGRLEERQRAADLVAEQWDKWRENPRTCGVCGSYLEQAMMAIRDDGQIFGEIRTRAIVVDEPHDPQTCGHAGCIRARLKTINDPMVSEMLQDVANQPDEDNNDN